jgi:hypothetical protein
VAVELQVEQTVRIGAGKLAGGANGQRGLAGAAHSVDGDNWRSGSDCGGQCRDHCRQFPFPADEGGVLIGELVTRLPVLRLVPEDPLVGGTQFRARFHSELLDQGVASPGVHIQCLGLAAPGVQGEHQLAGQAFVQRSIGYCGYQLGYDGGVVTAFEVQVETVTQYLVVALSQPNPLGRQVLARKAAERFTAV